MRDPAAQVQNSLVSNLDMTPSAGLKAQANQTGSAASFPDTKTGAHRAPRAGSAERRRAPWKTAVLVPVTLPGRDYDVKQDGESSDRQPWQEKSNNQFAYAHIDPDRSSSRRF